MDTYHKSLTVTSIKNAYRYFKKESVQHINESVILELLKELPFSRAYQSTNILILSFLTTNIFLLTYLKRVDYSMKFWAPQISLFLLSALLLLYTNQIVKRKMNDSVLLSSLLEFKSKISNK